MPAGYATFFALSAAPANWNDWCRGRLPVGEWLSYEDAGLGQFRIAVLEHGRLEAVLYAARQPELASIEWLKTRFALTHVPAQERRGLIAGRPIGGDDEGEVVCACFQVGRARILRAVAAGASTPAAIGVATRAGTNCGSCLPELKRLAPVTVQEPATVSV
jgi:assimilatory nitrate reductase catalytic subunit